MSGAEMSPSAIEFWDAMTDAKACISAKMRGIEVPDMSAMNEMESLLASREVKVKLAAWYRRWGEKTLMPPEVMEDDEAEEHAEELGLAPPINSTVAELRKLRVTILMEHVRRQEMEEIVAQPDDADQEAEDLQYSHRQGLIFAQESGWCRDVFPQDGTLVPDHIREEYGTIIIVHKYIKVGDERSDDIKQEFLFVSGIGHR